MQDIQTRLRVQLIHSGRIRAEIGPQPARETWKEPDFLPLSNYVKSGFENRIFFVFQGEKYFNRT